MKPPLLAHNSLNLGLFLLGITLWLSVPLEAQISTTIGSVVKGFSVPQHNDEGELISKIAGTQANTVSPNRAVIKELIMEFYNKGEVTMKVTSPQCDYWFLQSRLNTREGVTIERDNMVITAQNFQWEEKEKKGVLQKNVKVIIKDFNLSKEIPAASTNPTITVDTPAANSLPSEPRLDLSPPKESDSPLKLDLNSSLPDSSTPPENKTP